MEKMILEFYECIVQHFSSWEKPIPRITKSQPQIDNSLEVQHPTGNNLEPIGEIPEEIESLPSTTKL